MPAKVSYIHSLFLFTRELDEICMHRDQQLKRTLVSMPMSIILLLLRIQLNHGINPHNRNASLDRTLELLDLAHARLQDASLDRICHLALHQVEAVVLVRLLLGDGLLVFVSVAFLDTLRESMADAELRDEF